MDIIECIKKEQEKRGLTDTEMAKELGVNLADWSRFKNRKRTPSKGFLKIVGNTWPSLKPDIAQYIFS